MDRAERRRTQKALRKNAEKVKKSGIAIPPHDPRDVGTAAIMVSDKLSEERQPDRAANAAKIAQVIFDKTIENNQPDYTLACAEGCSFCCYIFTSLTAPEVFAIAKHVRSNNSDYEIEQILEKCRQTTGKGVDQRFGAKIPCALLKNDRCSVYSVRPIACRQCATRSSSDCQEAFNGIDKDLGYSFPHILSGGVVRIALHAALKSKNLPDTSYELGEALSIALSTPDAEQRWLNGENIFSICQTDNTRPKEHTSKVDFIYDVIR